MTAQTQQCAWGHTVNNEGRLRAQSPYLTPCCLLSLAFFLQTLSKKIYYFRLESFFNQCHFQLVLYFAVSFFCLHWMVLGHPPTGKTECTVKVDIGGLEDLCELQSWPSLQILTTLVLHFYPGAWSSDTPTWRSRALSKNFPQWPKCSVLCCPARQPLAKHLKHG